ncbi:hypothetical protein [Streptomyces flavofungini]|nr:hypothetical protein [Streptomyces flavofungini]WJV44330.1 hypothetical protein QUY26_01520 [Streptomyces flavofungini]
MTAQPVDRAFTGRRLVEVYLHRADAAGMVGVADTGETGSR